MVDVNTASQADLISLKWIGPRRASTIAQNRPYATIDDLAAVIGQKVFQKLIDQGITATQSLGTSMIGETLKRIEEGIALLKPERFSTLELIGQIEDLHYADSKLGVDVELKLLDVLSKIQIAASNTRIEVFVEELNAGNEKGLVSLIPLIYERQGPGNGLGASFFDTLRILHEMVNEEVQIELVGSPNPSYYQHTRNGKLSTAKTRASKDDPRDVTIFVSVNQNATVQSFQLRFADEVIGFLVEEINFLQTAPEWHSPPWHYFKSSYSSNSEPRVHWALPGGPNRVYQFHELQEWFQYVNDSKVQIDLNGIPTIDGNKVNQRGVLNITPVDAGEDQYDISIEADLEYGKITNINFVASRISRQASAVNFRSLGTLATLGDFSETGVDKWVRELAEKIIASVPEIKFDVSADAIELPNMVEILGRLSGFIQKEWSNNDSIFTDQNEFEITFKSGTRIKVAKFFEDDYDFYVESEFLEFEFVRRNHGAEFAAVLNASKLPDVLKFLKKLNDFELSPIKITNPYLVFSSFDSTDFSFKNLELPTGGQEGITAGLNVRAEIEFQGPILAPVMKQFELGSIEAAFNVGAAPEISIPLGDIKLFDGAIKFQGISCRIKVQETSSVLNFYVDIETAVGARLGEKLEFDLVGKFKFSNDFRYNSLRISSDERLVIGPIEVQNLYFEMSPSSAIAAGGTIVIGGTELTLDAKFLGSTPEYLRAKSEEIIFSADLTITNFLAYLVTAPNGSWIGDVDPELYPTGFGLQGTLNFFGGSAKIEVRVSDGGFYASGEIEGFNLGGVLQISGKIGVDLSSEISGSIDGDINFLGIETIVKGKFNDSGYLSATIDGNVGIATYHLECEIDSASSYFFAKGCLYFALEGSIGLGEFTLAAGTRVDAKLEIEYDRGEFEANVEVEFSVNGRPMSLPSFDINISSIDELIPEIIKRIKDEAGDLLDKFFDLLKDAAAIGPQIRDEIANSEEFKKLNKEWQAAAETIKSEGKEYLNQMAPGSGDIAIGWIESIESNFEDLNAKLVELNAIDVAKIDLLTIDYAKSIFGSNSVKESGIDPQKLIDALPLEEILLAAQSIFLSQAVQKLENAHDNLKYNVDELSKIDIAEFDLAAFEDGLENLELTKVTSSLYISEIERDLLKFSYALENAASKYELSTSEKTAQDLIAGLLQRIKDFHETTWQLQETYGALYSNGLTRHNQNMVQIHRHWSESLSDHYLSPDTVVGNLWEYTLEEDESFFVFGRQLEGTVPLFHYRSGSLTDHFYTLVPEDEVTGAGNPFGYELIGVLGYVFPAPSSSDPVPGTVPLYRYISPIQNLDHVYSVNYIPDDVLAAYTYEREGIECHVVPLSGDSKFDGNLVKVDRYWSESLADHCLSSAPGVGNPWGYVMEDEEFLVFSSPSTPGMLRLNEYRSGSLTDHFYGTGPDVDAKPVINAFGYEFVRVLGYVFPEQAPGTVALHSYMSPLKDHSYSVDKLSEEILELFNYKYEDVTCYVVPITFRTFKGYGRFKVRIDQDLVIPNGLPYKITNLGRPGPFIPRILVFDDHTIGRGIYRKTRPWLYVHHINDLSMEVDITIEEGPNDEVPLHTGRSTYGSKVGGNSWVREVTGSAVIDVDNKWLVVNRWSDTGFYLDLFDRFGDLNWHLIQEDIFVQQDGGNVEVPELIGVLSANSFDASEQKAVLQYSGTGRLVSSDFP